MIATEGSGFAPPSASPPLQLFISYSRADAAAVDDVISAVKRLGYGTFVDREQIKGGQLWWDRILAEIRRCDAMMVVVSHATAQSTASSSEREYARSLGKPIVPVMVQLVPYKQLPPDLAGAEVIDYIKPTEASALQLAAALALIRSDFGRPLPDSTPPPAPLAATTGIVVRLRGRLSDDEQYVIFGQLRALLDDPDEGSDARDVLRQLQAHRDCRASLGRDIDELLHANVPKKATAALLALFLGFLGVHNFYLGKTRRGLIQLAITVLTIGYGIVITFPWAVIECIIIASGQSTDHQGRTLA